MLFKQQFELPASLLDIDKKLADPPREFVDVLLASRKQSILHRLNIKHNLGHSTSFLVKANGINPTLLEFHFHIRMI
jgi:hypothetical protein